MLEEQDLRERLGSQEKISFIYRQNALAYLEWFETIRATATSSKQFEQVSKQIRVFRGAVCKASVWQTLNRKNTDGWWISVQSQRPGEEDVPMNHKFYGKLLEAASKAGRHLGAIPSPPGHGRVVAARWCCHGQQMVRGEQGACGRWFGQLDLQYPTSTRLLSCKVYYGLLPSSISTMHHHGYSIDHFSGQTHGFPYLLVC